MDSSIDVIIPRVSQRIMEENGGAGNAEMSDIIRYEFDWIVLWKTIDHKKYFSANSLQFLQISNFETHPK